MSPNPCTKRLVLAAALALIASCRDSTTAAGTALYVSVELDFNVEVTQLRFTASTADRTVLEPVIRPEAAGSALSSPQTLRIRLPDSVAGQSVRVRVEGLAQGKVAALGEGDATAKAGVEREVTVRLGPPAPTRLVFTGPSRQQEAGSCSAALELQTQDESGRAAPLKSALELRPASTSGTMRFYADPGCSAELSLLPLAAGEGSAALYFRDVRAGAPTLTASASDGSLAPATQRHTVTPGPARGLAFTSASPSIVAGSCTLASLQLQDAYGNAVNTAADLAATVSPSNATTGLFTDGQCVTLLGALTFPRGDSAARFYFRDTLAGPLTLAVSAQGAQGASQLVQVTAAAPSRVRFTAPPADAIASRPLRRVEAAIEDEFGNTVSTASDTLSLSLSSNPTGATLGGTTSVAATSGLAAFVDLLVDRAGSGYALRALAPGTALQPATSGSFAVAPPGAYKLAFKTAPASATAGVALTPAPEVVVQDALGGAVPGAATSVTLDLGDNPGNATLSGTTTLSAVNGVARFPGVSIDKAGAGYTLVASAPGLESATSGPLGVSPGAAVRLAFRSQPSTTVAGAAVMPVEVAVEDAHGNLVTSSNASISVGLEAASPAGPLLGTTTAVASGGLARFASLSLQKAGQGYLLAATSGGLAPATSAAFDVTPAAAAALTFAAPPADTVAGAFLPAVQVAVRDTYGNTVTASSAGVSIALASGPAGATLGGTPAATAVGGVAAFTNLSLTRAGSGYALAASSSGLTGATSNGFNVLPGAPARLSFVTQPSNTAAGVAVSPAVEVGVLDGYGNLTPSTATVTLALGANAGGATLTGGTTAAASVGVARLASLFLDKAAAGYTLSAASAGLAGATSAAFEVVPGSAFRLAFVTPPRTVTAGACSGAVTVQALDAYGNRAGVAGSTPLGVTGGSAAAGFFTDASCATPATGLALATGQSEVSLYFSDTLAGTLALQVSASGLLSTSQSHTVNPAAPARLAFVTPGQTVNADDCSAVARVRMEDTHGNASPRAAATSVLLASAATVTFYSDAGCAAAVTSVAISAGDTLAGFYFKDTQAGSRTLTASASPLNPANQGATVLAGPAAKLVFTTLAQSRVANQCSEVVTIQSQDALGNPTPVAADTTVALSSSSSSLAFFSDSSCSTTVAATVIAALQSSAGFYFKDTHAGSPAIVGSATGFSLANQTETIGPAAPKKLVFVTAAQALVAGACSAAARVQVQDDFGNASPVASASSVALSTTSPGGTFYSDSGCGTGVSSLSLAIGQDTAAFQFLDTKAGTATLTATATGLAVAQQAQTITHGPADRVAFVVQPSNTTAGATLTPGVQVAVQDAYGNTVTDSTAPVAVALGSNPAGGSLGGTTGAAAVSGIASFTTLSIQKAGAGYTLVAGSGTLGNGASAAFDIAPAAAARVVFLGQPSNTTAGVAISPAVQLEVQDAYGNRVTASSAAVAVSLGSNPAGGALFGTTPVAASGGVATFVDLSIRKAGAGYALAASSATLTGATSASFGISPAAPARVVFTTASQTVTAGDCSPVVNLQTLDAYDNPSNVSGDTSVALGGP
ncbi:MAG: beta strand repeat-containing protein, partial [Myxococcaceae bacterium]